MVLVLLLCVLQTLEARRSRGSTPLNPNKLQDWEGRASSRHHPEQNLFHNTIHQSLLPLDRYRRV